MKVITLTKAASYLYHNEYDNKVRFEIYELTKHRHPQDDISDISEDVLKVVDRVGKIFENNKKRRR